MAWVRDELKATDPKTPIIIALHMPLISVMNQFERSGTTANSDASAVSNSRQLFDLFKGHNLKLVLQGHQHIYEDILYQNIRFITGGALSGWKWNGPNKGTPAGFLQISTKGSEVAGNYIDYGWKPVAK